MGRSGCMSFWWRMRWYNIRLLRIAERPQADERLHVKQTPKVGTPCRPTRRENVRDLRYLRTL
jgi:hypothetical protein